ncbi:oxidoreductase [Desulforhopalus singaporensis]|uniref:2,4-dienoyl-CoA reductase (NADPH2) n=1 Tax=Desulforhopalus singaporensis TaxID=91360 RepID=A0A1H0LT49_9BACT|nr:FAD-dependent oxidoreductase [Desulforhopalus singaporensis]SDO71285.1 2,4-dienoyl-CoA reductase (NADPH2) [Desulforhopalus singaporensis]
MDDLLFQPITIGNLAVKNRISMPAMHTNMCQDFMVTDKLIQFYAERARGGVGMITVGYATVDELCGSGQCLGAHKDEFIPGLGRLAGTIKDLGARALVQINHPGRYVPSRSINGLQPVAPSAIPSRLTKETPRELDSEEIGAVVQSFADAAARVQAAGFDGVEVLCGTGYLISEFLSPLTNKRNDGYGGTLENRMRFGVEVISAIRKTVGDDFTLLARVNGNDFMPGGNSPQELQMFARTLEEAGIDGVNVNVGWHEARVPQIIGSVPRGVFSYLAEGIKQVVGVPVIAGHRINDPVTARELIADGKCDMVAMGRALIADPQLPNKAQSGREKEILHCVACGQGCFDHIFKAKPIECLCNPKAGHERSARVTTSSRPRRVMVVGGGAAGISAALSAAETGHEVKLYEKSGRLGGQLFLAGAPPGREEFLTLAADLANQVAGSRVQVIFNTAVDVALVEKEAPEAVILATGGVPLTPPIPGVELPHVVQAWDVLQGRVSPGRRIVVIGGGAVGVETALMLAESGTMSAEALKFLLVNQAATPEELYRLATRGSKEVFLIEMIDKIGKDIGLTTRWAMLQDISRVGVSVQQETRAMEITPGGVMVERAGKIVKLPCDTVVLAAGSRAYNPLQKQLEKIGISCRVIGDAERIGLVFDAIHSGFGAGRSVV